MGLTSRYNETTKVVSKQLLDRDRSADKATGEQAHIILCDR